MPELIRRDGLSLSLVITCLSGIMFFVAFSSVDWVAREEPPHRFGLWAACRDDLEERNCTKLEYHPGLQTVYGTKDTNLCVDRSMCMDSHMSFVFTVRVFNIITLIFWVASVVFYALCLAKYNAWFLSMACGFQFFGGLMCLAACLVWAINYHNVAHSLRWGFFLNSLSGSIMIANGIIFALLVCSGTCMRPPSNLGIVFRGEADIEHAHTLRRNKSTPKSTRPKDI